MKEKCKPSGKFMERVLTYDYSFRKQFSRLYNRDFLWYKTYIDMLHVINHCLCDTKLILLSCQRRQPTIFDMNISCTMYYVLFVVKLQILPLVCFFHRVLSL